MPVALREVEEGALGAEGALRGGERWLVSGKGLGKELQEDGGAGVEKTSREGGERIYVLVLALE